MDQAPSNLNYISCPSCLTLFKPKANKNAHAEQMCKCVCCGHLFKLSDTKNETSQQYKQPNLKYQANLPKPQGHAFSNKARPYNNQLKRTAPAVATTSYLKYYKFKSRMLLLLWILMPLFFLDLIVSTITQYKDDIAQNYRWRSSIQKFCNLTNCKLAPYNNLKYIVIEDNALVAAENKQDAIQLHAMLNNTAKYDQKFPDLKINFSDANGKLITQKKIPASEYMKNNNLDETSLFSKNSKQYICILLDDPGAAAVNYDIDLTS